MTSDFWKWLSRANARTALLAAVIAFILALAYWVWRELDPGEAAAGYNGPMVAEPAESTNRVQLLAFIRNQQENGEKAANNPFYKKPVWRPDPQPTPPDGGHVKPPANNGGNGAVTPPKPKPPPPPPPPKEVPVMYRGIMTRPDGTIAALIENQDTQKQKFFAAGDALLTTTVEGIGADAVTLKKADGSTVTLARGQVAKIRED